MSEIVHDITVRKDMEAALLRNEAKYRSIFENAVEGIFQTTAQGRHLRANLAYVRMFGYSSEEELIAEISDVGRQMYAKPIDFFTSKDRTRIGDRIRECFEEGETATEAELLIKDGSTIPYFFTGKRVVLDNKVHLLGVGIDISERKKAEQTISEREEKYH